MNQLKVGVVLNYVVIILSTLVGLLYTPYMLRMMGQSEYGLYSLVSSVISYLTILDLGFGNAIVRYTAKFRAEGKVKEQYEMFGMFLILYIIVGVVALFAGSALYFNVDTMFGDTMTVEELEKARIMMLILVFNVAFTFPMSIFGSIISAYEHFVFPRIVNIIRIVLNTAVMIILLSIGYKAIAMVIVQTIFNVITLLANYIYCKRQLKIEIHFGKIQWNFLKEIAIYSFWIFIAIIIEKIYWSSGQFVLGSIAGTVAVSIFAVAIHLENMYMQFSTSISSVLLPKVTGIVALGDNKDEISNLFIKTGRLQYCVIGLILWGFILFGKPFVRLWAGVEYAESFYAALAFFVALFIPMVQTLGITVLQARNQMKFRSLIYFAIAIFALILEIVLSKHWGVLGCAFAISFALLLGQGLIMNIYYQKVQKINIKEFWKQILKMSIVPLLVSSVGFVIISFVIIDSWLKLFLGIIIYLLILLPCFISFSMNQNERDILMGPIKKIIHKQ